MKSNVTAPEKKQVIQVNTNIDWIITNCKFLGKSDLILRKAEAKSRTIKKIKLERIAKNCQKDIFMELAFTKESWKPNTKPPSITMLTAPLGNLAFISPPH